MIYTYIHMYTYTCVYHTLIFIHTHTHKKASEIKNIYTQLIRTHN